MMTTPMTSHTAAAHPAATTKKKTSSIFEHFWSSTVQFIAVNGATAGILAGTRRYREKKRTLDVFKKSRHFSINPVLLSQKGAIVLASALLIAMSLSGREPDAIAPSYAEDERQEDFL